MCDGCGSESVEQICLVSFIACSKEVWWVILGVANECSDFETSRPKKYITFYQNHFTNYEWVDNEV